MKDLVLYATVSYKEPSNLSPIPTVEFQANYIQKSRRKQEDGTQTNMKQP